MQDIATCVNGTRGCLEAAKGHPCDTWLAAKRVEAFEQALEAERRFDAEQAAIETKAFAKEERLAWDRYAAAAIIPAEDLSAAHCAGVADALLEERRKRFGSAK